MVRLARTADGRALVGDEFGFVPVDALVPGRATVRELLPRVVDGTLPSVESAVAKRQTAEVVQFGPVLERFGKLWGIGLNYKAHADDLKETWPDEPASFMKPHTTVTGPGGPVRLPPRDITERVTAEAELGVVVGRTCSSVPPEQVSDVVAGYVPIIDMTAEDILQRNPRYLTRSKSFDSFLVVGPWMVTTDEVPALEEVTVRTVRNGEVMAENSVANMHMGPHELVSFHSEVMTLEPGDIISTGTPGATVIESGDDVEAVVTGVGRVSADVVR